MQFYNSVMFLGLPDDIHDEKPSFLQFKKNALPTDRPTNRRTEGPTDQRTDRPSYRDARTQSEKRVKDHTYTHTRASHWITNSKAPFHWSTTSCFSGIDSWPLFMLQWNKKSIQFFFDWSQQFISVQLKTFLFLLFKKRFFHFIINCCLWKFL